MFDALKRFILEVSGAEAEEILFGEDDYRLAAVALLIHVANVDGGADALEQARLQAIVKERFGLDARATSELIEKAAQSDRDAVDFYQFTSILKRALDDEGRLKIVEMMWDVAFADGAVDEFEENTIWRVAELLSVSNRDRVLLRQRVAAQTPPEEVLETLHEGPWSVPAIKGQA
jgi:uncharacterized tellurite resistance protein B-like protein